MAAIADVTATLLLATMSFQQVHVLLTPPSLERSQERALDFLNANFKSLEQYDALQDSDGLLEDARARSEALDARVRPSTVYEKWTVAHGNLS